MLSVAAEEKLRAFELAFVALNRRLNLVARGDMGHFRERHIEHCLTLLLRHFPPEAHVVDWGTGGGLPAIPLAIAVPNLRITAVDSVRKKILAVRKFKHELQLSNLVTWCGRAELWPGSATHSVSRATTKLVRLWQWHRRIAVGQPGQTAPDMWTPGALSLKGGDLSYEIAELRSMFPDVSVTVFPLARERLRDKVIVHVCPSAQVIL